MGGLSSEFLNLFRALITEAEFLNKSRICLSEERNRHLGSFLGNTRWGLYTYMYVHKYISLEREGCSFVTQSQSPMPDPNAEGSNL
jgi:hypothetical protein